MKFILGTKKHMTEIYRPDGRVVPATIISVSPCVVTSIRSLEKDGYIAFQVGTGERKRLSRALAGHFGNLGKFKYVKEFRAKTQDKVPELKVGDTVDLSQFEAGDNVMVTGVSKGRGFQGVVKRHGFHGSPKTHGHKDQLRMPGSIGSTGPARVFKGTKMGGRMGGERSTVRNLEVVSVNIKEGELAVKGAIPGAPKSLVLVQTV